MDIEGIFNPLVHAHLSNRFQKRQRLDIADSTSNFDHDDVHALASSADPVLHLVGDVRNDLNGATEVIAPTFATDHLFIDLAGGEVVLFLHRRANEAFIVAQIEIGFGAIFGHENLTMLKRTHGARVNIDIWIELHHADF